MLTQAQWQWLWNKTNEATELNKLPLQDWLFELITEAGLDVRDGVVVKLAE